MSNKTKARILSNASIWWWFLNVSAQVLMMVTYRWCALKSQNWVPISALPFHNCVTWGGSPNQMWPPKLGIYYNHLGKLVNHKDTQTYTLELLNPLQKVVQESLFLKSSHMTSWQTTLGPLINFISLSSLAKQSSW